MSRKSFLVLLISAMCSIILVPAFVHQVAAKESVLGSAYEELKLFADVVALVRKNYVNEVNMKDLAEGAVKGMLQSLDPHSSYMDQESFNELQVETKGEFGGLGIEINVKDGILTVIAPIEGSPAETAGVQAGDQIIKVGDEFTKNMTLIDAVKKMRGPKGSPITLTVHRENKPELIPITILRDVIRVQSVRSRMLEQGFGYVRLAQFQEESGKELREAIEKLNGKGADRQLKGLVIDLRNDPGGLLSQAVETADIFLKEGLVVYTDGRLESQKQKFYAQDDKNEPQLPIVVLINGGSASAAEILAGALQDAKLALVVGTQSFGKGSVQTVLPMDNGSALRLTTALYYTRNGRSIQARGITPDVVVPARRFLSDQEELLEEDEVKFFPRSEGELPGAIKNPQQQGKGENIEREMTGSTVLPIGSRLAMEANLDKLFKEDPQLEEAMKLLRNWYAMKQMPKAQTAAVNLNQAENQS
ncbi:S41 family peptidase [bacterium]|nr:S41 family peptidase [bacterium]